MTEKKEMKPLISFDRQGNVVGADNEAITDMAVHVVDQYKTYEAGKRNMTRVSALMVAVGFGSMLHPQLRTAGAVIGASGLNMFNNNWGILCALNATEPIKDQVDRMRDVVEAISKL